MTETDQRARTAPTLDSFAAYVAARGADGSFVRGVRQTDQSLLASDGVLVRVLWSSVNYKDALAASADGKVARLDTLVPGIDLAGEVVDGGRTEFRPGDLVVVHGYGVGVSHHGGFSQLARVPAEWIVPLPDGLTPREAMVVGTAGFTAALSVLALLERGLEPDAGDVLVTGASGGVGGHAVAMLATLGFSVVASSGQPGAEERLRALGAREVVGRDEVTRDDRPLSRERWAGAVDCVGDQTLSCLLASLQYGGAVAASGNTGGITLTTTVFPFILRGVALLGIDSVQVPVDERARVWQRIATDLRPASLDLIGTQEVGLGGLDDVLDSLLAGGRDGRTVVDLSR